MKLLENLKSQYSKALYDALIQRGDLATSRNLLTQMGPDAERAVALLNGTEFEEVGQTALTQYHALLKAIDANESARAKQLLAELGQTGFSTEPRLRELLAQAGAAAGPNPASPKHFWFDYHGPQSPGKRYWTAVDQTWVEQYESGESSRFNVARRTTVEGTPGSILVKVSGDSDKTGARNDGTFQVFIPDLGSRKMQFCFRFNVDGEWQPWQPLAEMQGIE